LDGWLSILLVHSCSLVLQHSLYGFFICCGVIILMRRIEIVLKDEKQLAVLKDWLRGILHEQPVTLTFTKKDGTIRVMRCTLNESVVPQVVSESDTAKTPRKVTEDAQSVWDIEAQGWRSFRWDSLTGIEFSLGDGNAENKTI
jgi:hypothetical protein